jgi:hypothetical protein
MQPKNLSLAQRETFAPTRFRELLWWLSTAERELIADCVIDRNRYAITGMVVLCTWTFATVSWTYFFSTVTAEPMIFVPLGLFMGWVILSIDRALIKNIGKGDRNRGTTFLIRASLALLIGSFMAQPAILYLFRKEIHTQVSLDNEARRIAKAHELDSLYGSRRAGLTARRQGIMKGQETASAFAAKAREDFIREADGTGGTGRVGIEAIARAKKAEYDKLEAGLESLRQGDAPALSAIERERASMDSTQRKEEQAFAATLEEGFLTRIEALQHLLNGNAALRYRYYLLMAILVLIELMPVIAKMMLPSGTYEEKMMLREEMEKEMAFANMNRERELKELYNRLMTENDGRAIEEFFTRTREKRADRMRTMADRWTGSPRDTFDGVWDRVKRDILGKLEN